MLSSYAQLKKQLLNEQHVWLITGVAGFIGSHLLEQLLQLNQQVIGIDNFATGHQENLDTVFKKLTHFQASQFTFYEGDICSFVDCKKVITDVEYILHQAALGSVPRSIETPEITNATNVTGFLNVLIAAKNASVKRFVYASSSSVYGDSPSLPKKEETIGRPLSPYAVSKYTNELYAQAFSACYGLETIGLRYFNVFGSRQDSNGPYAAVIPRWINALKNSQPVYIHGDGKTTRDFCYVKNAVQANLLAAMTKNPEAVNKVYNVAVGEQHSLNELYNLIVNTLELPKKPQPIYQDFRQGDIRNSLADVSLIKADLCYEPTHTLQSGLKDAQQSILDENIL